MPGLPSHRIVRVVSAAAPLIFVFAMSGCESDRYPTSLTYPLRTDLLVLKAPDEQVPRPSAPGLLDEDIARIGVAPLSGKTLNPLGKDKEGKEIVPAEARPVMQKVLTDFFGTPARPRVGRKSQGDVDDDVVVDLKIDSRTLAEGSKLYRRHCLHCHGLAGDGRGPAGPWLSPHPRDYRKGEFKFISSDPNGPHKPRREDLLRTLRTGIDGTSMPSFALLEEKTAAGEGRDLQPLEALVSYVIHLSIRGQVEYSLLEAIADGAIQAVPNDKQAFEAGLAEKAGDYVGQFANDWAKSGKDEVLKPNWIPSEKLLQGEEKLESIRRGYKLFADPEGAASCIACHADFGRQAKFRYDVWGTHVRPANLTAGVYRGGRRPIDLFWRIRGGVTPSGMPKTAVKEDKDVWDVVNFVQALPYPNMLPEDVRYKIYDRPGAETAAK
jgi:mono/diheme cytochrome c family protein